MPPQKPAGVTLSAAPLGTNVAPWSNVANNAKIEPYLKALGPVSLRYGGGVWADAYNWQVNKDTYACAKAGNQTGDFTGPCASSGSDSTSYAAFSAEARAVSARGIITVNYGTGTPALAGAWAAKVAAGKDPVQQFEIGNEPYGCASPDLEITQPPVSDTTYEPNTPARCPYAQAGSGLAGIKWFATSYIAHAPAFITAVKKANPSAQIVLPYAISPPGNSGYAWNDAVMPALKGKYNSLSVLWYPHRTPSSPTDAEDLTTITSIPKYAAGIKADIAKYSPGTSYTITEANNDNQPTTAQCKPVGAVYAAGTALEWLAQGAQAVDWWVQSDGNNSGSKCVNTDFSMFNLNGTPQTSYWGYLLASKMTQPAGRVLSVDTANTNKNVLAFHVLLRYGKIGEAYVNLSTKSAQVTSTKNISVNGLTTWRYEAAHPSVVTGKANWKGKVTVSLPGESVTVLEN